MHYIIVNSSSTFDCRIDILCEVLIEKGHTYTVISSDFRHIEKNKRVEIKKDYHYIKTIAYKKNISLTRLLSHYRFTKDVFDFIKNKSCDVLYLVIPPNSQGTLAKLYKSLYPNTRIVVDIIDMWPESLPIKGTSMFPITLWGKIRDNAIRNSDYIITECELYQKKLLSHLASKPCKNIYWSSTTTIYDELWSVLPNDIVNLCYLGSINNIIDIKEIGHIIKQISQIKPVVFHVIGDGEKREKLLDASKNAGAHVVYHGKIYDAYEKQKVFAQSHFGLNIMKQNVCVGLTMKSIEYFSAGLPIINNIPGDTEFLVNKYSMGINISETITENIQKEFNRYHIREVYEDLFSAHRIRQKWIETIEEIESLK